MAYSVRDRSIGPPPMFRMTTGVKWLLISNVVVFVAYFFALNTAAEQLFLPFGLVPRSVLGHLEVWQLFTYLFIHSPYGFGHVLMNMLMLWMFGTPLEGVWGTRRFLQYYFFCGVGAGVCVVVLNLFAGSLNSRTIGASGAIYGLMLAFGILFPRAIIYFMMLFPIEARWFVLIMGAIVFLSTLRDSGGGVSHIAHLGGMLFGFIWLKMGLGYRPTGSRTNLWQNLRDSYHDWRLKRARRKFQVYLKKQGTSSRDWEDRVQ